MLRRALFGCGKQAGKRTHAVDNMHSGEEEGQRDKRQQLAVILRKRTFDGECQITQRIGNEHQQHRQHAYRQSRV